MLGDNLLISTAPFHHFPLTNFTHSSEIPTSCRSYLDHSDVSNRVKQYVRAGPSTSEFSPTTYPNSNFLFPYNVDNRFNPSYLEKRVHFSPHGNPSRFTPATSFVPPRQFSNPLVLSGNNFEKSLR